MVEKPKSNPDKKKKLRQAKASEVIKKRPPLLKEIDDPHERADAMKDLLVKTILDRLKSGLTGSLKKKADSIDSLRGWIRMHIDIEYSEQQKAYALKLLTNGTTGKQGIDRFAIGSMLYAARQTKLHQKRYKTENEKYKAKKQLDDKTEFVMSEEEILRVVAYLMMDYLPSGQREERPNTFSLWGNKDVHQKEDWRDWSTLKRPSDALQQSEQSSYIAHKLLCTRHLKSEVGIPKDISIFERYGSGAQVVFFLDKDKGSTRIYRGRIGSHVFNTAPNFEVFDADRWLGWRNIDKDDPEYKGIGENVKNRKKHGLDILDWYDWAPWNR